MNVSRRKKQIQSIVIFSILVTVVAWMSPWFGGSPSSPGLGFILWGTAPFLVSMLMRAVTRDWSDLGIKPAIRKNALWYGMSVFAAPALMTLVLLLGAITSTSSVSGFSMVPYLNLVLPGMAVFFLFAIFEEFGWRGYFVPKLASLGINDSLAYAIVAVVWATWHMPYIRELTWVSSGTEELVTFIPRYYLLLFVYSIIYHEVRVITGSVWPAVLLHSITNAIQHPLAVDSLKILPGMDYLSSFTGFFMVALVGLLGIALRRWRRRKVIFSASFASEQVR